MNLKEKSSKKTKEEQIGVILLVSLALHVLLACITKGHPTDVACFTAWAQKVVVDTPAGFYSEGYFADYPPGYVLILGLTQLIENLFRFVPGTRAYNLIMTLFPTIADLLTVVVFHKLCTRHIRNQKVVRGMTWFMALQPLTLFDTSVWKQVDGVLTLPLMICFLLLDEERYVLSALFFGLALCVKPQALLAGPIFGLAFLVMIVKAFTQKDENGAYLAMKALGTLGASVLVAVVPVLLSGIPFYGVKRLVPQIIQKYASTAGGYPYGTVNACNFISALGGNWSDSRVPAFLDLSWNMIGTFNLVLVSVSIVVLVILAVRRKTVSWTFFSALYLLGIFALMQNMHERYLYPGVLLALTAAVMVNDRRIRTLGIAITFTTFFNLFIVYASTGTSNEFLENGFSRFYLRYGGLFVTVLFFYGLWTAWDLMVRGVRVPIAGADEEDTLEEDPVEMMLSEDDFSEEAFEEEVFSKEAFSEEEFFDPEAWLEEETPDEEDSEPGRFEQAWDRMETWLSDHSEEVNIVKMAVGIRLALYVLSIVIMAVFGDYQAPITRYDFLSTWCRWDSAHYLNIAQNGYAGAIENGEHLFLVFYPLYPFMLRLFTIFTGNLQAAGILIAMICFPIGCLYLYRVTKEEYGPESAYMAVKLLCLFPFSFFYGAVLTESLFLVIIAPFFYYLKRHRWGIVTLLGFFACLCKNQGLLLCFAILFELLSSERFLERVKEKDIAGIIKKILLPGLFCMMMILGFVVYLGINYMVDKDPFKFLYFQKYHWNNYMIPIWKTIAYLVKNTVDTWYTSNGMILWMPEVLLIFLYLAAIIYAFKSKMKPAYTAYLIASFLLTYSSSWLVSAGRYTLSALPLFMLMAEWTKKHPKWKGAIPICSALLLAVNCVAYFEWRQIM